jgi:hypothetical protein
MIYKNKGIIYSQFVLEYVNNNLENNNIKMVGVDTFYNCREQGYCLTVYNKDYVGLLTIWIYAQRNSDEPTMTYKLGTSANGMGNSYDEESWIERTKSYSDIFELCKDLLELINKETEVK